MAKTFAVILKKSMENTDLVAHVEVLSYGPGKRIENKTLYRIEAKVIETFKGPSLKNIVFFQWIYEENRGSAMKEKDITGEGLIVTLDKYAHDDTYRVPEGGYSFPDFESLFDVARKFRNQNAKN